MPNQEQFWNSPQAVAEYTAPPYLFRGERLAFAACRGGSLAGADVLDLACGGGRTTSFLHAMGAKTIGVDIAENLIAAARRDFPGIDFRVGDAIALQFADESFDLVLISFNSLDCLYPEEERLACLAEVRRVLRPGGLFIFSTHNTPALLCGWYRSMRPSKLAWRSRQVLNGGFFHSACFMNESPIPGMHMHYAWPRYVVRQMRTAGFEMLDVFPNEPILAFLHRTLHTAWLTRLADPWPYFAFRKLTSH